MQAMEALSTDPLAICACGRDHLSFPLNGRHVCLSPLPNPNVREHQQYLRLFR